MGEGRPALRVVGPSLPQRQGEIAPETFEAGGAETVEAGTALHGPWEFLSCIP